MTRKIDYDYYQEITSEIVPSVLLNLSIFRLNKIDKPDDSNVEIVNLLIALFLYEGKTSNQIKAEAAVSFPGIKYQPLPLTIAHLKTAFRKAKIYNSLFWLRLRSHQDNELLAD